MNKFLEYLGILMLLGGIAGAVYFFGFFKTTVTTQSITIQGQSYGGEDVSNIGLLADRQNGLILSIGSAILGTAFLFAGHSMTEKINTPKPAEPVTQNQKRCSTCGNDYTGSPKFCPNCGSQLA